MQPVLESGGDPEVATTATIAQNRSGCALLT